MARFGHWADKAFTKARVQDQYSHRFKIHFPNEERAAGRPARTRPAYEKQKAMGAVFGLNFGWEHPLWFSADGDPKEETIGFTRQNWWGPVGREARMALLEGRHSVSTSTGPIPVLDLSFWLRLQPNRGEPRRTVPAVVVASSSGPTAVLVDEIAGEQELLLRSLGPRLANVRRYSGGMVASAGGFLRSPRRA